MLDRVGAHFLFSTDGVSEDDTLLIAQVDSSDCAFICYRSQEDKDEILITAWGWNERAEYSHIEDLICTLEDHSTSRFITVNDVEPRYQPVWKDYAFYQDGTAMRRHRALTYQAADSEQMRQLGASVAHLCRPGDLIVAIGDLGAGKTTFTQGMGIGLGVDDEVCSPTFVLSRIHYGNKGLPLVHVDAYRLGSAAEVDDIDLDASLSESVTVVEWGRGIVEQLSDERLELTITRSARPGDETRQVMMRPIGLSWVSRDFAHLTDHL